MVEQSGSRNARQPENYKQSLNSGYPTTSQEDSVPLLIGSSDVSLDEMIQMHLVDCDQCQHAIMTDRPRAIGQKSSHCNTYWELQLMRAKIEGKVNNIVAHTEYGDEAPKGRPLE